MQISLATSCDVELMRPPGSANYQNFSLSIQRRTRPFDGLHRFFWYNS